jgi:predicted NAD/FAD-binding protein
MRVAVIGGGIAGLAVAWMTKGLADVVLYEREAWLGGHARTVEVDGVPAETGFKYMFDSTHGRVLALLATLGIATRRTRASASVRRAGRPCVVLPPRSFRHAATLARDGFARSGAAALARVHLDAARMARTEDWSEDLATYLSRRFSPATCSSFLVPFFAASWGMPVDVMAGFAAYDVAKVLGKGFGGFLEIEGGASRYVEALVAELAGVDLRRATGARAVRQAGAGSLVVEADDGTASFDHVVLAVPANRAADLLEGSPEAAALRDACARFRYVPTDIAIHRDASFMPARREDWSVVNYVLDEDAPFITEWCGHRERRDVFRTWLVPGRAPPAAIHHRQSFEHLVVTPQSLTAHRALARLQGQGGLWVAGMYVADVDVQESALASAMDVARRIAPASPNLRRLELTRSGTHDRASNGRRS